MELPNRPTRDPYQEIPVKDFSYVNANKDLPKKHHSKLWLALGVVVIALAVAAYLYGQATKTKPTPKVTTKSVTAKSGNKAPNIQLTSYTSTVFNLTVSYPTNWSVNATISSSISSSMSIDSPTMDLTSDTGKTVSGRVEVNVYNQGQLPTSFGTTSVAVLNSTDLPFTSPSSDQAAQSYVSFIQYPTTTATGGLDAIYLTGNNGYIKDQNIPASDVNQVDPLIIVSFVSCSDSTCTNSTNLTIDSSMWNNSTFALPILDILKSFQFS